ncbi:hypothetical protein CVT25_013062 [Psilocybe cyanescens]|uniref:Homeobox domain-containing protein n=1 Tax=Psilocybe cyanescens TaxID=93625 RepID=A0A409XSC7_PSICY|nr:hypothetical protein CVT25_013062 [Psilocybe cyanescens]
MGYQNNSYPRPLVPNSPDSAPVDFRAFYPYTPNEVKHRKRTTSAQLKVLEAIFKKDTKPNASLRNELALELDMTARGVQVWFQNRRAKEKVKGGKGSLGSKMSVGDLQDDDYSSLHIKDELLDSLLQRPDSSHDEIDAYSRSPSGSGPTPISPPTLRLVTDSTNFPWQNSPVDPTPDSATFPIRPPTNTFVSSTTNSDSGSSSTGNNPDLLMHRRGSLPLNAFPQPSSSLDSPTTDFDPFLRRCSVDASLARLAQNPFASLARAKNSALYGPGVGVVMPGANNNGIRHHHQLTRLPYGYHPPQHQRRGMPSSFASMPQQASIRRLSMDSRQTRFTSISRTHQSQSPSPVTTPYNAAIRVSLPDQRLFALSSRPLASPIPGPLPSPGFSFGAASTPPMASPSSGDSERNSPDSLRSFSFRGDDEDNATSPSYDAYSRFGSIASIATSESSINSSYYGEIGGAAVDHRLAEDRRDSCASGHFLGMLSGLDVGNGAENMHVGNYSPHEDYQFSNATDGVELVSSSDIQHHHQHHQQAQQQNPEANYPSPTSTITPRDSPHAQDAAVVAGTPPVPISTSSELAFALESKSNQKANRQEQYLTYGSGEHQPASVQDGASYYSSQQHQNQESHSQEQQQDLSYASTNFSEGYSGESHQHHQQPEVDYLSVYNPSVHYTDALSATMSTASINNGMQNADAFTAYT